MYLCHFVQPHFQLEFCMTNIDETWYDSSAILGYSKRRNFSSPQLAQVTWRTGEPTATEERG